MINTHFNSTPGTEINIMRYKQGNLDAHTHDFLELVYIAEGSAIHTINGQSSIVNPGDIFIIDFSGSHSYKMCESETITIFNVLFTPRFVDPILSDCRSFGQILEHYLIKFRNFPVNFPQETIFHDENKVILNKITEMENEYLRRSPGYGELLRCELIEIIILILRKLTDTGNIPNHPCTQQILEEINNNYMTSVTLSDISKKLNYSTAYLSRLFKNETGVVFAEFLQKKRIESSCRLLLNSDKKVSEIAEMVGYSDLKSFQSAFKKITGMPPKAYQKMKHK